MQTQRQALRQRIQMCIVQYTSIQAKQMNTGNSVRCIVFANTRQSFSSLVYPDKQFYSSKSMALFQGARYTIHYIMHSKWICIVMRVIIHASNFTDKLQKIVINYNCCNYCIQQHQPHSIRKYFFRSAQQLNCCLRTKNKTRDGTGRSKTREGKAKHCRLQLDFDLSRENKSYIEWLSC